MNIYTRQTAQTACAAAQFSFLPTFAMILFDFAAFLKEKTDKAANQPIVHLYSTALRMKD
jgi:hypothetical protein